MRLTEGRPMKRLGWNCECPRVGAQQFRVDACNQSAGAHPAASFDCIKGRRHVCAERHAKLQVSTCKAGAIQTSVEAPSGERRISWLARMLARKRLRHGRPRRSCRWLFRRCSIRATSRRAALPMSPFMAGRRFGRAGSRVRAPQVRAEAQTAPMRRAQARARPRKTSRL